MVPIVKRVLVYVALAVLVELVARIVWPTDDSIVPVIAFFLLLFGWRMRQRRKLRPKRIRWAEDARRNAANQRRLASQRLMVDRAAQAREAARIAEIRGQLAYDRETQQTWNYDGTRKTPREMVVAKMDTYTFEVTPAKYRVMQEWFDDALEPGIYTLPKERSGPERIE